MHSSLRPRAARRRGVRFLLALPIAIAALPAASANAGTIKLETAGCAGSGGVTANQFTVPTGVSSIQVVAHGAAGGASVSGTPAGGQGAWIQGTISVTAGTTLYACV